MSEATIQADGETLGALITIRGLLDQEIQQSLEEGPEGISTLRLTLLHNARSKVEDWVDDVIEVIEWQAKKTKESRELKYQIERLKEEQ